MEIKFSCPYCDQPLGLSEEMLGMTFDCPACSKSLKMPESMPEIETAESEQADTSERADPALPSAAIPSAGGSLVLSFLQLACLAFIAFLLLTNDPSDAARENNAAPPETDIAATETPSDVETKAVGALEGISEAPATVPEKLTALQEAQSNHAMRLAEVIEQVPDVNLTRVKQPLKPEEIVSTSTVNGWTEHRFSHPIEKAVFAQGGRVLVLKNKGLDGLRVYDPKQGNITVDYPQITSQDFMFTAGGSRVMLYDEMAKQLIYYSTHPKYFRRSFQVPMDFGDKQLLGLWMGSSNPNTVLFRLGDTEADTGATELVLYDTISRTKITPTRKSNGSPDLPLLATEHVPLSKMDSSADGNVFVRFTQMTSRPTASIYVNRGNALEYHTLGLPDSSYLFLGDDKKIYTTKGILTLDSSYSSRHTENPLDGLQLIPCPGGQAVLALHPETYRVQLLNADTYEKICDLPAVPLRTEEKIRYERYAKRGGDPYHHINHRFHFDPVTGDYVVLPPGGKRILHRKVDLSALARSPYLFLRPLSSFQKHVRSKSTIPLEIASQHPDPDVRLVDGPPGMTLTQDQQLKWDPPENFPAEYIHLDLILSTPDDTRREVSWMLRVLR